MYALRSNTVLLKDAWSMKIHQESTGLTLAFAPCPPRPLPAPPAGFPLPGDACAGASAGGAAGRCSILIFGLGSSLGALAAAGAAALLGAGAVVVAAAAAGAELDDAPPPGRAGHDAISSLSAFDFFFSFFGWGAVFGLSPEATLRTVRRTSTRRSDRPSPRRSLRSDSTSGVVLGELLLLAVRGVCQHGNRKARVRVQIESSRWLTASASAALRNSM